MTQNDLFRIDQVQSVPRSGSSDPPSSEAAENKARKSGLMKAHALIVLGLIKSAPGRTSRELAAVDSFMRGSKALDRYQVARRTKELESAKLIRRTEADKESRWWPISG